MSNYHNVAAGSMPVPNYLGVTSSLPATPALLHPSPLIRIVDIQTTSNTLGQEFTVPNISPPLSPDTLGFSRFPGQTYASCKFCRSRKMQVCQRLISVPHESLRVIILNSAT